MLSVIIKSFIMGDVVLNVVILSAVILNVMAPKVSSHSSPK
jgi:hypothetical protein